MNKTFTLDGIIKEFKRVRWSDRKSILRNTALVLAFTLVFAIVLMLGDLIAGVML